MTVGEKDKGILHGCHDPGAEIGLTQHYDSPDYLEQIKDEWSTPWTLARLSRGPVRFA
jgi:hypothetical protein